MDDGGKAEVSSQYIAAVSPHVAGQSAFYKPNTVVYSSRYLTAEEPAWKDLPGYRDGIQLIEEAAMRDAKLAEERRQRLLEEEQQRYEEQRKLVKNAKQPLLNNGGKILESVLKKRSTDIIDRGKDVIDKTARSIDEVDREHEKTVAAINQAYERDMKTVGNNKQALTSILDKGYSDAYKESNAELRKKYGDAAIGKIEDALKPARDAAINRYNETITGIDKNIIDRETVFRDKAMKEEAELKSRIEAAKKKDKKDLEKQLETMQEKHKADYTKFKDDMLKQRLDERAKAEAQREADMAEVDRVRKAEIGKLKPLPNYKAPKTAAGKEELPTKEMKTLYTVHLKDSEVKGMRPMDASEFFTADRGGVEPSLAQVDALNAMQNDKSVYNIDKAVTIYNARNGEKISADMFSVKAEVNEASPAATAPQPAPVKIEPIKQEPAKQQPASKQQAPKRG